MKGVLTAGKSPHHCGNFSYLAIGVFVAILLRISLFPFVSLDMSLDMLPWANRLQNEGVAALAQRFSNYPPLYLYLLWGFAVLPLPKLYAIKLLYVLFDLILAWYSGKLIEVIRGRDAISFYTPVVVLLIPTVVLNSSCWGQCDAMYTSGIIACIYYLLRRLPVLACVGLGVAISLKPQAVFIAPLMIALFLQGRLLIFHLLIPFVVYALFCVPAWLVGRSFTEMLTLYAQQKILPHPALTLGATNLYQWVSPELLGPILPAALAVSCLVFVLSLLILSRVALLSHTILIGAAFSCIVMPYVLPFMHERYFYCADIFTTLLALTFRKKWWISACAVTASTFTYLPFLFHVEPISRKLLTVLTSCALFGICRLLLIKESKCLEVITRDSRSLAIFQTNGEPQPTCSKEVT
jgi:Gpi18-like mannosyltransferase